MFSTKFSISFVFACFFSLSSSSEIKRNLSRRPHLWKQYENFVVVVAAMTMRPLPIRRSRVVPLRVHRAKHESFCLTHYQKIGCIIGNGCHRLFASKNGGSKFLLEDLFMIAQCKGDENLQRCSRANAQQRFSSHGAGFMPRRLRQSEENVVDKSNCSSVYCMNIHTNRKCTVNIPPCIFLQQPSSARDTCTHNLSLKCIALLSPQVFFVFDYLQRYSQRRNAFVNLLTLFPVSFYICSPLALDVRENRGLL
ncbi:Hypothetical protein, putative [Bodo saltans]|uniref:Membrane-associated protein n=1 Tax=Bodo saltans TaxID=75058 RepID=A0A0S4J5E6_BODSA|nr:Hypothetical protein, putative [Bodo saltans]|eukprot:CUG84103.1 Hypothetical protein, putative [Bodo saltans]